MGCSLGFGGVGLDGLVVFLLFVFGVFGGDIIVVAGVGLACFGCVFASFLCSCVVVFSLVVFVS